VTTERSLHPWLNRIAVLAGLGAMLHVAGPIPLAGGVAILLVVPGVEWALGALRPEARAGAYRLLHIFGPPLFVVAVAITVRYWPAVLQGRPVGLVGLLALVALMTAYVLAGLCPAALGRWLVSGLRAGGERVVLWDLVEAVRRRRALFRWCLLVVVLGLSGVASGLLAVGKESLFPGVVDAWLVPAVLVLLGGLAVMAWGRAEGLGWPEVAEAGGSPYRATAQQVVEGVALAAGTTAPAVSLVAHARPTAFTVIRRSTPLIVMTTGLVSALPRDELEAVAAHEVAHIISGGVDAGHTMEVLLDLVRLLGAVVLVLFLLATRTAVGLPWALLAAALVIGVLIEQESHEWDRRPGRLAEAALVLFNPVMVAANVLASAFYHALGRDEDLLADLRAVELTRHPGALHAVLRRLRDTPSVGPPLPAAYHYRYFTGEGTSSEDFPQAQATIGARLALLERLDPGLCPSSPLRQRVTRCPDCGQPLAASTLDSHYGVPIQVDRCPSCGGFWFDDPELYLIDARGLVAAGSGGTDHRGSLKSALCPRCRVTLRPALPYGTPGNLVIMECSACGGAWVRPADLAKFGAFRHRRAARKSQGRRSR
jgi:heat shock protein HtpX